MELLNSLGISSTLGIIGFGLLVIGAFLILAGIGIISIQQITVKQGTRTWIVGVILVIASAGLLFRESVISDPILHSDIASEPSSVSPQEVITPEAESPVLECGKPEIRAIQPPAILEGEMQLYTVIGSGFCSSTNVFVDTLAWVGKTPGIGTPDGTPASVSDDGTQLTVYVRVEPQSDAIIGVSLGVENPGGQTAVFFVEFHRAGE